MAAQLVLENGKIQVEGMTVTLKLADAPKPKSAKQILKEAKLRTKELQAQSKPTNATDDTKAATTPSSSTTSTSVVGMSATAKKKAATKAKKNAVRKIFVGGLQQTMTKVHSYCFILINYHFACY
jgi:hypothetical protein